MYQTLNKNYSTTRRVVPDAASITGIQMPSTANQHLPYCGGGLRAQGYSKYAEDANKPLISIITVVYNGAKHIEKTISSILEQTYDNVEYIIIDGGSTDGTLDIIKKYQHAIDYWVSEPDNGIYDAMNKGISLATGDYIHLLNSDDSYIGNNVISMVVDVILTTNYKYISCSIDYHLPSGSVHKLSMQKDRVDTIPHPGLFLSSYSFKKNNFDLQYKYASDLEFFLRTIQPNSVFIVSESIVKMLAGGAGSGIGGLIETAYIYIKYKKWKEAFLCCAKIAKHYLLNLISKFK